MGGFNAYITITNTGPPVSGWTLRFNLPPDQIFGSGWSATWTPGPAPVTATNLDWNANLATGATAEIGFTGHWTGTYTNPTSFTLNSRTCTAGGSITPLPGSA